MSVTRQFHVKSSNPQKNLWKIFNMYTSMCVRHFQIWEIVSIKKLKSRKNKKVYNSFFTTCFEHKMRKVERVTNKSYCTKVLWPATFTISCLFFLLWSRSKINEWYTTNLLKMLCTILNLCLNSPLEIRYIFSKMLCT